MQDARRAQRTSHHVLRLCYARRMVLIASRELRNDTAGLLRRVEAGEEVVITVRGRAVAELVQLRSTRRRWLPWAELIQRLPSSQADPGLRADLARLAGDATDDLGPVK